MDALSIVLAEGKNQIIREYDNEINTLKSLINMLLKESLLKEILDIIDIEKSYSLSECIIDIDCLERNRLENKYTRDDIIKLIPLLQLIGVHVIQFNENDFIKNGEIIYLNWMEELCPIEIEIANRYGRNIFMSNKKSGLTL